MISEPTSGPAPRAKAPWRADAGGTANRRLSLWTAIGLATWMGGCGPADPNEGDPEPGGGPTQTHQDILTTDLALNLTTLTGRATVKARPSSATGAVRLDVSKLTLSSVTVDGKTVEALKEDGLLTVTGENPELTIVIDYTFPARPAWAFDGWMPALGVTFVWPYYCANLFPCDPSMRDGVVFTMDVTGVEEGLTAIYPRTTTADGPAYMAGITVGDYVELALGTTPSGTSIKAWYLENDRGDQAARRGTAHLVEVFDYFETTYGAYSFGPEYGSVEVNWGEDSWGGMEHHPYSHIGTFDMNDEEAHAHEAGHGWYGNGVRVECWEDFVLSEGTTTYIAARAMEQVGGDDLWSYYVDYFLEPICEGQDVNTIVLPSTCDEIDFVNDDLWSLATYMKGACFYEDVADLIGADALDEVIGTFYVEHVNRTARMRDMLEAIHTKADPADREALQTLEEEWLYTEACPADYATRCRARQPR